MEEMKKFMETKKKPVNHYEGSVYMANKAPVIRIISNDTVRQTQPRQLQEVECAPDERDYS